MPVLFYDLETFGLRPGADRIAEFAGILTDDNLSLMDQPWEHRCLPPPDMLASPGACLTTGITPQMAQQTGLPEPDFARSLQHHFRAQSQTLIVGYNNASFDDEFIRHLFYRTFLDPYEWHWASGNRRLDVLNVIPALFDFQRDALVWPRTADGLPDFRLEALSAANETESGTSHEALADTFALRNLCNTVREHIPDVWARLPDMVTKRSVEQRLRAGHAAFLSGRGEARLIFSAAYLKREDRASALCIVVGREAGAAGAWWLVDLSQDAGAICALDPKESAAQRFARGSERPESLRALIRLNPRRLPMVFVSEPHHRAILERGGVNMDAADRSLAAWSEESAVEWARRFITAVSDDRASHVRDGQRDVDEQLYDALPHDDDRRHLTAMSHATTREMATYLRTNAFTDARYQELSQRFFGRYMPTQISAAERDLFRHGARTRVDIPSFDAAWTKAYKSLEAEETGRSRAVRRRVLSDLLNHRNSVVERLGIEGAGALGSEEFTFDGSR